MHFKDIDLTVNEVHKLIHQEFSRIAKPIYDLVKTPSHASQKAQQYRMKKGYILRNNYLRNT